MTIETNPWHTFPGLKAAKDKIDEILPGWEFTGPYIPGKNGPWLSFIATKGNKKKYVQVPVTDTMSFNPDQEIIVEDICH